MKFTLKFFLLFLIPLGSIAQFGHPDSLVQNLKSATTDSLRVAIMSELVMFYLEANQDSSFYYCDKIIQVARKNDKKLDEAAFLGHKGYVLYHQGNYAKSLAHFLQALEIAENIENKNKTWFQHSYPYTSAFRKPGKTRAVVLENLHHDLGHLLGKTGNIEQRIFHFQG